MACFLWVVGCGCVVWNLNSVSAFYDCFFGVPGLFLWFGCLVFSQFLVLFFESRFGLFMYGLDAFLVFGFLWRV